MKRIAIVGISGSGKSTLARKLGDKLGLPVIHLDKHFWNVGWKQRYPTKAEFDKVAQGFAEADSWIIDGNYRSSLDARLEKADTIIFLDYPKWLGLWRAFKRIFNRKQPFDKTEGVKDKIDFRFIKFVLTWPCHEMRARVKKYKNIKKVYIARNDEEKSEIFKVLT